MAYIASSNIEVFPNAQRAAANPTYLKARKMTEENTTGLLKHTVDNASYVITQAYDGSSFEFVIGGYYVKVKGALPLDRPLYAHILVRPNGDYEEFVGRDDGDDY